MDNQNSGFLVILETARKESLHIGLEALLKALELKTQLKVALDVLSIGRDTNSSLDILPTGIRNIFQAAASEDTYLNAHFVEVIISLAQHNNYNLIVLPATNDCREIAARCGTRLQTGVLADCIDMDISPEGYMRGIKPVPGTDKLAFVSCPVKRPQIITLLPGYFGSTLIANDITESTKYTITELPGNENPTNTIIKLVEVWERKKRSAAIEKAEIIVAAGAGMSTEEDFQLLNQLANLLGAPLAGTRPVLEKGLISSEAMIGQSGISVSPKAYLAFGISGSFYHMAGIKKPEVFIAINNDPRAEIFNYATHGIVSDAKEVALQLVQSLSIA